MTNCVNFMQQTTWSVSAGDVITTTITSNYCSPPLPSGLPPLIFTQTVSSVLIGFI